MFRPQYNPQFFVRSNYRMQKVVLMMELFITLKKPGSPISHARTFSAELCLLDDTQQSLLRNGTRHIVMEASNTNFKDAPIITLSITDIPQKHVGLCDMLPDVVVWNPSYFKLCAAYRVCLGYFVRNRADPTSADATFDAVLGLFPRLCDQPDMLDLLMALCQKKKLNFSTMNESFMENFNNIFVFSAFGINQLATLPKYDLWDEPGLKRREEILTTFLTTLLVSSQNPLKFQTETRVRPIDIHSFAVDLCGPHAID
uniref:DZF domain-containing protein n=1 Tax=Steinernema glaseri TaxID=37863 RepID=A0A1I7ZP22_9BILA